MLCLSSWGANIHPCDALLSKIISLKVWIQTFFSHTKLAAANSVYMSPPTLLQDIQKSCVGRNVSHFCSKDWHESLSKSCPECLPHWPPSSRRASEFKMLYVDRKKVHINWKDFRCHKGLRVCLFASCKALGMYWNPTFAVMCIEWRKVTKGATRIHRRDRPGRWMRDVLLPRLGLFSNHLLAIYHID